MKTHTTIRSLVSTVSSLAIACMFAALPTTARADQVDAVEFSDDAPAPQGAHVQLSCSTPGAIIFYKINSFNYPGNPTHSGSTPTNGTGIYNPSTGGFRVSWGSRLYIKAVAYVNGMTDSVIVSYVSDNTGL